MLTVRIVSMLCSIYFSQLLSTVILLNLRESIMYIMELLIVHELVFEHAIARGDFLDNVATLKH